MEKLYFIPKEDHNKDSLFRILDENKYIKFVSISGIDLAGHETDEKIPVEVFRDDIDGFLNGTAVQTDGSSVILPGIATLNNAKIDMVVDKDVKWWVDYNIENIDEETKMPVATLKIPCFLYHEGVPVDSRSILKKSMENFEETIFSLIKNNDNALKGFDFTRDDVKKVEITSATELEFWVMTPEDKRELEELSASQELKEQYWSRTKGNVRTALEKALVTMEKYGLSPEMGHKEVGGVKSKLYKDGSLHGIMEQLEIDWKYSTALQSADNEVWVKYIVKETFRNQGMEVTYLAKPLDGVAGSGEHTHIGVMLTLNNGKKVNLFTGPKNHFMSRFGYGAVMGILKNYEVISPFVVQSNDAFRRLKKGFEAPICIVTSLGVTEEIPSRNRTILLGLIRDLNNPYATRFELRSPNPHTNTYLCITTMLLTMLDGINYAILEDVSIDDLLKELSKKPEDDAKYLEKGRQYRSELDVFEEFTDKQRDEYFGDVPKTVYENLMHFENYKEKVEVLKKGDVLTDKLINSYKLFILRKWHLELLHRIIPKILDEVRGMKMLHNDLDNDLDLARWLRIRELRNEVAKDTGTRTSLITHIRDAFTMEDYKKASEYQLELYEVMDELRENYSNYKKNIID